MQLGYSRVVQLVALENDFKKIMSAWCFSRRAKDDIRLLMARHKAIFEYMAFRSFLHVYIAQETCIEEVDVANQILEMSVRAPDGTSADGLTHRQELAKLDRFPERMRAFKQVFRQILEKLDAASPPPYRAISGKTMHPFAGIV